MSEIDGKATGWMAFYRDGKWVEEQTKKAPAKKKAAAPADSSRGSAS